MEFFATAYKGKPPWEIGRPQKEFVEMVRRGDLAGSVLDIGCGTGENALFYAAEGYEVWGIDAVPRAIEKAQEKAAERGLPVHFLVLDALHLTGLNRTFDSVTDSGFFHTLSDADRTVYVNQLAAILNPGGHYFMLCFSDREPPGYGPRRISEKEIRDTFRDGWTIHSIRPATFESHTRPEGSRAWFSSISRVKGRDSSIRTGGSITRPA